eukprot:Rmarinus@m.24575
MLRPVKDSFKNITSAPNYVANFANQALVDPMKQLVYMGTKPVADFSVFATDAYPAHRRKIRKQLYLLFEDPSSSFAAYCVSWLSFTAILVAVVVFCLGTVRDKSDDLDPTHRDTMENVEVLCVIWFTIEFICRWYAAPDVRRYIFHPLNIIDLVAILPFYIELILASTSDVSRLGALRAVRLVRVLRVLKLSRHSIGLFVMLETIKQSVEELALLSFFLFIAVIMFATAVYVVESSQDVTEFVSIPAAFWWAVITMTTVGYGDMYPETVAGKVLGVFCAISGVLVIALPVGVIGSKFTNVYRELKGNTMLMRVQYEDEEGNFDVPAALGEEETATDGECPRPKLVTNVQTSVEVPVDSAQSALAAIAGGATALYICSDISHEGYGVTPSAGLFMKIMFSLREKKATNIAVTVHIRPRLGDYIYSLDEVETAAHDMVFLAGLDLTEEMRTQANFSFSFAVVCLDDDSTPNIDCLKLFRKTVPDTVSLVWGSCLDELLRPYENLGTVASSRCVVRVMLPAVAALDSVCASLVLETNLLASRAARRQSGATSPRGPSPTTGESPVKPTARRASLMTITPIQESSLTSMESVGTGSDQTSASEDEGSHAPIKALQVTAKAFVDNGVAVAVCVPQKRSIAPHTVVACLPAGATYVHVRVVAYAHSVVTSFPPHAFVPYLSRDYDFDELVDGVWKLETSTLRPPPEMAHGIIPLEAVEAVISRLKTWFAAWRQRSVAGDAVIMRQLLRRVETPTMVSFRGRVTSVDELLSSAGSMEGDPLTPGSTRSFADVESRLESIAGRSSMRLGSNLEAQMSAKSGELRRAKLIQQQRRSRARIMAGLEDGAGIMSSPESPSTTITTAAPEETGQTSASQSRMKKLKQSFRRGSRTPPAGTGSPGSTTSASAGAAMEVMKETAI